MQIVGSWIALVVGGGIVVVALGLGVAWALRTSRMNRVCDVEVAATVEYGASIGVLFSGCHGTDLAGFSDPGTGVAPNLTPHETGLAAWTHYDMERALRTGTRPDGTALSDAMPWRSLSRLTDTELAALWAYLRSLDPLPSAVQ